MTPTLSTRTVALIGQPDTHLKLPLPTSTLGLLNRRSIAPGTLADGALVRGIVATACRDDPLRLGGLLLADESSYAHAGHPYLGYLLRRLPSGLDRHRIVPVAALLAPSPDGGPDETAAVRRWSSKSLPAGRAAVTWPACSPRTCGCSSACGAAVRPVRHRPGVAPAERRPVLGETGRLRLLVKDFDGALIHFRG